MAGTVTRFAGKVQAHTGNGSRLALLLLLAIQSRQAVQAAPAPPPATAAENAARRTKLLEALEAEGGKGSALLLRTPPPDHFAGDVNYLYRPDNNFYYLTGIEAPGCALLLDSSRPAGEGRETLFMTPIPEGARAWVGEGLTVDAASAASGLLASQVLLHTELAGRLTRLEVERGSFYFEAGSGFAPGKSPSEPYAFLLEQFGSRAFQLRPRSPERLLARQRQIKSPTEIALLEHAIGATTGALLRAGRELRAGEHEYDLRAVIEATFLREGCSGWSFPPIVASGPNSCILHYQQYDRALAAGDLVVLDIGAECRNYAADVTRTFPVSGRFTPRQLQLYRVVLKAQEAAIDIIKPGIPHHRVHETAFREVAAGLQSLGLITTDAEAHRYFTHGSSHGLGLDVHDPIVSPELEPGMVITVEPGVYLPEEKIGIRIEDDVLVTSQGHRILSTGCPRTPEEVEALLSTRAF